MKKMRCAVAGTGFIGPVHVEALQRIHVEVVGVLGSTPDKSRAAASQLGLAKAYDCFDDLLADSDVASVHITTPNRFHYAMTAAALQAGKHVMCEKPLAMTTSESAELVRLAAAAGVAAGVNYNIRFYPLCLEAAERVRSGQVGEIFHVTGGYVQDWLLYEHDFNWRVLTEQGGRLRAIADIGTHWLDLLQFVTGRRVIAVCADLSTVHAVRRRPMGEVETFGGRDGAHEDSVPVDIQTEDCGSVLLHFAGGATGSMSVSQVTAGRKNCLRFEVAGSQRALAWNSEQPNELWIGQRAGANELLLRDPSLLSAAARRYVAYPGGHNEGFSDTFKHCFLAFYDYIAAGDLSAPPTFPTLAEGHREIQLCEAILTSHDERRWVDVDA